MTSHRGIILSDLDGTFLDEAYHPVLPSRELARVLAQWRVIWVTSRTVLEVQWLQRLLRHRDDAIAENGGVFLTHSADVAGKLGRFHQSDDAFTTLAADDARSTLALVTAAFASVGRDARTFFDLTPTALARRAQYQVRDAVRAQHRTASVVLTDVDMTDPATLVALASLRAQGCSVSAGNHWTTVVRGSDKGSAALRWLQAIDNRLPVVAIGDGDNDRSLLAVVDTPFVIRRTTGTHHPALSEIPNAHLLSASGTAGWCEMLDVLDRRAGERTA